MATSEGISKTERSQATRAALTRDGARAVRRSAATPASAPRRSCAPPASRAARSTTTSTASSSCSRPSTRRSRRSWSSASPAPSTRRRRAARGRCAPGVAAFLDACRAIRRCSGSRCSTRRRCSAGSAGARSGCATASGSFSGTIEAAIEAGEIEPQPAEPLAHLLLGAIDEGAMLIARAPRRRRDAPAGRRGARTHARRADEPVRTSGSARAGWGVARRRSGCRGEAAAVERGARRARRRRARRAAWSFLSRWFAAAAGSPSP